jgi:G:T-mismatch repair DNA endonuclease (very short patch repair protein)
VVVVWECQILKDPAESAARTGQNIQKAKDQ